MDTLAHGYTMADIDGLARRACAAAWAQASDYRDRYNTAWSAIVVALYEADDPLPPSRLVHAGVRAVDVARHDDDRHRGRRRSNGGQPIAFQTYWEWAARHAPSPESRVVDGLALQQIWSRLTPAERRCLSALAATGDYQAAADLLGVRYHSLCSGVRRARARFLALWHEGETPSQLWGRDRRRWRADVDDPADQRSVMIRRRRSWNRAPKGAA